MADGTKISTWMSRNLRTKVLLIRGFVMLLMSLLLLQFERQSAEKHVGPMEKCPVPVGEGARESGPTEIESRFFPPEIICVQDGYPPAPQSALLSGITFWLAVIFLAAAAVVFIIKVCSFFGWFSKKS